MKHKYYLPVIIAILFGSVFVAGKYLADAIPPATLSALRYSVTVLVFLPILFKQRLQILSINRRDWILIVLAALLGITTYHVLFYWSLHFTSATNVALIHAANPLLTLMLAWFILKQVITRRAVLGFCLAVVGITFIVSDGSFQQLLTLRLNTGELLMLIATISWAGYTVLLKGINQKKVGSSVLTGLVAMIGWLLLLPLSAREVDISFIASVSWSSWLAVLYMGAGSSGLGYWLYTKSARDLGPATTSLLVYSMVPLVVAIIEWLWLGVAMNWIQAAGFIFICCGLVCALTTANNSH